MRSPGIEFFGNFQSEAWIAAVKNQLLHTTPPPPPPFKNK